MVFVTITKTFKLLSLVGHSPNVLGFRLVTYNLPRVEMCYLAKVQSNRMNGMEAQKYERSG